MNEQITIEFVKLISGGRSPKRAERSAAGFLPSRAMRYCDAITSATGYGYWLFPPMSFSLIWDGEDIFWSMDGGEEWLPLSATPSKAAQFPGFADEFDGAVPEAFRGYSPPFLSAMPEVGGIQIWTGLLAKSRPGWSSYVRAPVNLPTIPGLVCWEGIIETDLWLGPLFNNFRITKTDFPIHISSEAPFLQLQPVPQLAYRDELLNDFAVVGLDTMVPEDWERLGKVLLPNPDHEARQGLYAVTVRKRRLCPVAQHELD